MIDESEIKESMHVAIIHSAGNKAKAVTEEDLEITVQQIFFFDRIWKRTYWCSVIQANGDIVFAGDLDIHHLDKMLDDTYEACVYDTIWTAV